MGHFTIEMGMAAGQPKEYTVKLVEGGAEVKSGGIPEPELDKVSITAMQQRFIGGASLLDLVQDGRRLFGHLYKALGTAWTDRAIRDAHILLEIADEDLRRAPWEIMHSGSAWLSQQCSIVRSAPSAVPFTPTEWPLRVLVLVGTKDQAIGAEDEARKIVEALRPPNCLFHFRFSRLEARAPLMRPISSTRPH